MIICNRSNDTFHLYNIKEGKGYFCNEEGNKVPINFCSQWEPVDLIPINVLNAAMKEWNKTLVGV